MDQGPLAAHPCKKEIRVGTVEIRQNFNTINAKGHNIRPKTAESETPPKETTWFYTLCKVVDDDSARDFIGCYQASNISQQTTKDGIHVMQIIGCDSKTGFANRMVGVFRDTVRISPDSVVDIGNQAGQLYFFPHFRSVTAISVRRQRIPVRQTVLPA